MRIVDLEHQLLDADLVAVLDTDLVIEETAVHPAGHVGARRLGDDGIEARILLVLEHLVESFQNERDPADLAFAVGDLEVGEPHQLARYQPLDQRQLRVVEGERRVGCPRCERADIGHL